jgi:hypothetical protein
LQLQKEKKKIQETTLKREENLGDDEMIMIKMPTTINSVRIGLYDYILR